MPAGKFFVDPETIPNRRAAHSTDRLKVMCTGVFEVGCTGSGNIPQQYDGGDGVTINGGQFRVICPMSHVAFDDPIVWPRQAGRTHLHQFYGNTSTRAASDVTDFENVGDSTCFGGTINRSAYWAPVFIYHCSTAADILLGCNAARDGEVIWGHTGNFYYKTVATETTPGPSSNAGSFGSVPMQWPPAGFNMITGCPTAATCTAAQSSSFHFVCVRSNSDIASYSYIPTAANAVSAGGCDAIKMTAGFPRCWNNVDLGTPTGFGHMSADLGDVTPGCPVGYPILFPGISVNIEVEIDDADLDFIRLSSDLPKEDAQDTGTYPNCAAANNWCAGRTMHSDWVNGWSTALVVPSVGSAWGMSITDAILQECYMINNNPAAPISRDCHNHLLGSPLADDNWWGLY